MSFLRNLKAVFMQESSSEETSENDAKKLEHKWATQMLKIREITRTKVITKVLPELNTLAGFVNAFHAKNTKTTLELNRLQSTLQDLCTSIIEFKKQQKANKYLYSDHSRGEDANRFSQKTNKIINNLPLNISPIFPNLEQQMEVLEQKWTDLVLEAREKIRTIHPEKAAQSISQLTTLLEQFIAQNSEFSSELSPIVKALNTLCPYVMRITSFKSTDTQDARVRFYTQSLARIPERFSFTDLQNGKTQTANAIKEIVNAAFLMEEGRIKGDAAKN